MRKKKKTSNAPPLRVATIEDLPAIVEMIEDSHRDAYFSRFGKTNKQAVAESFGPLVERSSFVVADKGGRLVGLCGFALLPLWFNPGYRLATTAAWWVDRNHRQNGLGTDLLREVEAMAREAGAHALFVTARKDSEMAVHKVLGMGYRLSQSQYIKELQCLSS